jgi:plastocyanin
MTDTTTTDEPEQAAGVEAPAAADVEAREAAGEPVRFWDRPYVERYLTPLLLPLAVVLVILVYVLNVSRLFLSAHGHLPVVMGTAILLVILIGASVLAAATHMRRTSMIMITAGFLLLMSTAGWISLGHSEEKGGGLTALPATLQVPAKNTFTVTALGSLKFQPAAFNATTGLAKFDVAIAASGHTFNFHETNTLFGELLLNNAGQTVSGVAFFPTPGDYNYFCSIPGHEAAGMKGVVHVTGPPVTLEQAVTQAGNPPGALGAGAAK